MVAAMDIQVTKTERSKLQDIDLENLPFGKYFTDHMLEAEYENGRWTNVEIKPYQPLLLEPSLAALHYGQAIFEGIKAYKNEEGRAFIFRPYDNFRRFNISAERMNMPEVPEEIFIEGMRRLIELDEKWVPAKKDHSLYIRPFMFSSDEYIGIRPSLTFTYMVILSPVGFYYNNPVRVKVETHFTRAAQGGTGSAKTGGNYGGALYPAKLAQDQGYHQLIWTDGKNHEYIEESGTMNVMFVIGDTLITPALSDSILPGITRDSVLRLARAWDIRVEERKISVKELIEALEAEKVQDVFGVGTAATIAPIQCIGYKGKDYILPSNARREFSTRVLEELDGIKHGTRPDPFGWIVRM